MINSEKFTGLTSEEAENLLKINGLNSLPEEKNTFWTLILKNFFSPVPIMLIIAALLSFYEGNLSDFYIIIFLSFLNLLIAIWHEKKADKSIKELQKNFTVKVNVFRDKVWKNIDSTQLVIGDIINLNIGMIVPADISIIESKNFSVNESVLTGESLPKDKSVNDISYSGSFVTTGSAVAKVIATGSKTFFGKTISSIDIKPRRSTLEKEIISISKYLSIISAIIIFFLTVVFFAIHSSIIGILTLDISLLIAGIPIALPTVMTLIISVGVFNLSKKKIVVRRTASLEDLANVDLLLSDKTGTLTQNKIEVERILPFDHFTEEDVVKYAVSSINTERVEDTLDNAIFMKAKELKITGLKQDDYIPGDSERKRSTAFIEIENKKCVVSYGAPQIISSLCSLSQESKEYFDKLVLMGAKDGFRSLAVAINKNSIQEKNMELVGILFVADNLWSDAKDTIEFMKENDINVKMITGDNIEISKRIAKDLSLKGQVLDRSILDGDKSILQKEFDSIAAFSAVLPKDKYDIVSFARNNNHIVAMTGDGVNDLPAIKNADVGFAVSGAVDALKSGADIILLKNGISVIKDSIIEARKIFTRLYNYSVYRISESFRLIITIAIIGFIYKVYPLTPVQIVILAFLNDLPIISLAFDKVKSTIAPTKIDSKRRFILSTLFGMTGVANSMILLFIMLTLHIPWNIIQTVFFLKLTVSGHMLIYVAHTEEVWYKFLPSKPIIIATISTQLIATIFAFFGIFTTAIPLYLIVFVWVWSFIWMQISELIKHQKLFSI